MPPAEATKIGGMRLGGQQPNRIATRPETPRLAVPGKRLHTVIFNIVILESTSLCLDILLILLLSSLYLPYFLECWIDACSD